MNFFCLKARHAALAVALISMFSCVKSPDKNPDPGDGGDGTVAATVGDIVIRSFKISTKDNAGIYEDISFVERDGNNYLFDGAREVKHYKADLTSLAVSFDCNAADVTIGSVSQESGVTENDFSSSVTYRFYAADNNYVTRTVILTNPASSYSGLPLLVLTVDDSTEITSKEVWKSGRIRIDPQESGLAAYDKTLEIRGRGNNSWSKIKKPYALKLSSKDAILGMVKHKRWAVLANYSDKTLLRNRVAFELGKRTGLAWTPDSRYVDLILNGTYRGSYQVTEQVRVDSKRVNVDENDGYLIEVDRYYDEPEELKFRSEICDLPVMFKNPEFTGADPRKTYIKEYFADIERLLNKDSVAVRDSIAKGSPLPDMNDPRFIPDTMEYYQLIDINSFIDYWIVQELVGNNDSRLPGSIYMTKDKDPADKLFAGPLWDFDLTTFKSTSGFKLVDYVVTSENYVNLKHRSLWYTKLFKDPKFKAKAKERWTLHYPGFVNIPDYIDTQAAIISKSAKMNWELWTPDGSLQNGDNHLPWSDAVEQMKTTYTARLGWLDGAIRAW